MCIQSNLENNLYVISNRNFSEDYLNYKSASIDMIVSGKYLYKYPKFKLNYSMLGEYPLHKNNQNLIECIKMTYINHLKGKEILIGSGANGLIQNIVKVLFKNGGNLVTPYLTFDQVEFAVNSIGGYTKRVKMGENKEISTENILNSIDENTKMIYICNPNNPTGMLLDNKEIISMAKRISNIYLVVDESAIEFSNKKDLIEEEYVENLIIIKSFSKAYGISNLRVGFMVCSNKFSKIYAENTTVNEVSGISCEYARKVIESKYHKKNIEMIINEREKIIKSFQKFGFEFYPSNSNILFSKTYLEKDFVNKIIENRISLLWIKDDEEKLHFRIAIQDKKTNDAFIKKCSEILKREVKS